MAFELLLPKFGMAMESAKILAWKKDVGDNVEREEAVLTVENEKLTSDVVSMQAGVLLQKVAQVGEKYRVGDILGYIGEADEMVDGIGAESGDRVAASPLAKKLATSLGLDISKITGSGPGGRIVKEDVEKYAEELKQPEPAVAASRQIPAFAADAPVDTGYADIPYAGLRQAVGEKMLQAWTTVPMVTHHVRADAGSVLEVREAINKDTGDEEDKISINDVMLKLVAAALKKKPMVNASFTGKSIRVFNYVNLGVATALENGLVVPVIRDAEKKSLIQISREAKSLIDKARCGKLTPDDVSGGTFTVSNLGGYGSVDEFTPIVNPPQAAILGIGRIADMPVCIGSEVRARPMVALSFTYDHRVLDGAVAAEFMKILINFLSNPIRALCE